MHLAEFNIGKLKFDVGDSRLESYIHATEIVNRVAERSPGFVWKYETDIGGRVPKIVDNDPRIVLNLSIWTDGESLKNFVWNTLHKKIYLRQDEWFEPLDKESMVLWNIKEGHLTDLDDAIKRLEMLRSNGPTDFAYDWAYLKKC